MKNAAVVVLFVLSILGALLAARAKAKERPFEVPYIPAATATAEVSASAHPAMRRVGQALEQLEPGPLGQRARFRAQIVPGPR